MEHPANTGHLILRLCEAQAAVVGLRRALRRLIAAEREFSRDTGIRLDDLITEAVEHAELVLAMHKNIGKENDLTAASRPEEKP